MFVNVCVCMVVVLAFYVLLPCLYGGCVCLRGCMHVCECVCWYGDCVVFVCVSGHVCIIIVCVLAFV